MRRFSKIRRFNKGSQIFFYRLKRNKVKLLFYTFCVIAGVAGCYYLIDFVKFAHKFQQDAIQKRIEDARAEGIILGCLAVISGFYFADKVIPILLTFRSQGQPRRWLGSRFF
jgi:hypothetical protein